MKVPFSKIVSALLLPAFALFSSKGRASTTQSDLVKDQVISVANKYWAEMLHSPPVHFQVTAEKYLTLNNPIFANFSFQTDTVKNLRKRLAHQPYWIVSYTPEKMVVGGSSVVFVLAQTGRAVGWIGFK